MGSLVYLDSKAHVLSSIPPHLPVTPHCMERGLGWWYLDSHNQSFKFAKSSLRPLPPQAGDSTCLPASLSNVWGAVFGGRAAGIPGALPQTRLTRAQRGSKHPLFCLTSIFQIWWKEEFREPKAMEMLNKLVVARKCSLFNRILVSLEFLVWF